MACSRILALGLLFLWGCGGGGDGGGDCDPIAATLISRIEVTPSPASIADGDAMQLSAKAFSCDGSQLAPPVFTWQSADESTVTVSTSGLAVGVKLGGPVAIKASAQGKVGTAQVSVVARAVASVRVEPATASVAVGRTSTLVAKAFDAQGNELPGRTASWSSANEAVVTVSQQGAITGVAVGGPVVITATIEGHSGTAQVSVTAVAVASVTVTPPAANVQAGSTVQLTAVLKDDQGNVLTGRAVLWSTADGTRASVSNTGLVTGVAAGGPVTILATSEGISGSSQITVTPAPAAKLVFLVQPSAVAVGAAIAPAVQVEIQNVLGNRVPSSASVTIALGANPGSASLTGTTTVNAVNGVATFNNLRLNRPAAGYTLTTASTGLTGATSSAFNVNPGPPVSLQFVVQPNNAQAGTAIDPPIQVELLDAGGNRSTGATDVVSLSMGNNPGNATLSGTTSVNAVGGVATFSGLSLNVAASGYTLAAASGVLSGATSSAFDITPGAPAAVSFVTQPTSTPAGSAITPAVQVEIRDAQGNLVTAPTSVTLSIGDNPAGGILTGTLEVTTTNGVATFDGLIIDQSGAGYTLVASAAGLNSTSSPFDVTPGAAIQLGFAVQPGNIRENDPFTPEVAVEVRDARGNRVTTFSGNVSLQLRGEGGGGAGGGNRLIGGEPRPFVQGLAVFSGMTVNIMGPLPVARAFTLRTQGSIQTVLSSTFNVSPF